MAKDEKPHRRVKLIRYTRFPSVGAEEPDAPGPFILAGGLLLLAGLAYTVQPILTPIVLFTGLLYFLFPWRERPIPRRFLGVGMILFGAWLVVTLLGILAPFIVAFLLAYLLNPLVVRLEARRIPRWLASLLSVALLAAVGVGAALFLFPVAFRQFDGILSGLRLIVGDFVAFLNSGALATLLAPYGIDSQRAQDFITAEISPKLEALLGTLFEGLFGVVAGFSTLVLQLINIIIIPFVVFYLLKDFPEVTGRLRSWVPRRRREKVYRVIDTADAILGRYFRGAVIVAVLQGFIAFAGLWFLGVDYPVVLGIMTGILNFIPYVGLLTSLVVASIVAVFSGGPIMIKVLGVVVLYLAQKLLEATVLGPKIVGSQVGLHPVLLILCLLVFGHFLGFVGLLIAVPVTAVLMAFFREWEAAREAGA